MKAFCEKIYKFYIRDIYRETLSSVQVLIQDRSIYLSIDEAMDADGRLIGKLIVRKLWDKPINPILLNCEKVEKSNN